MHADRLMRPDPAPMLGIDVGLGPLADRRLSFWDESFVPMLLMQRLREVRVCCRTARPRRWCNTRPCWRRRACPNRRIFRPTCAGPSGALELGLPAAWCSRWRVAAVAAAHAAPSRLALSTALLCRAGGLLLAALWGLTEHTSAWRNANILLLDPLCLLLLPAWWRARPPTGARVGAPCVWRRRSPCSPPWRCACGSCPGSCRGQSALDCPAAAPALRPAAGPAPPRPPHRLRRRQPRLATRHRRGGNRRECAIPPSCCGRAAHAVLLTVAAS